MDSKIIEAIHLAKEVLDICGGDAWERECSSEARQRFYNIYEELYPSPLDNNGLREYEERCEVCNLIMPKGNMHTHLNGKRHKKRLALNSQNIEGEYYGTQRNNRSHGRCS